MEDPAVHGEGHDALLDPGPGAVVEAHERDADGRGQVHDLVDLLGEDLAERTAEHGEVLGEDAHLAAVDRAPAGDDAVGVGALVEPRGPRAGQLVELDERTVVEQVLDALPGGHLALGVLSLDGALGAGVQRLLFPLGELFEPLLHRMVGHRRRGYARREKGPRQRGAPLVATEQEAV